MLNKAGRPQIEVDLPMVEKMAAIMCTQAEIGQVLGFREHLFQEREDISHAYKKGRDYGQTSLRRMQWEQAKKGNATMLIWLGKQYLGQRDKHEVMGELQHTHKADLAKLMEAARRNGEGAGQSAEDRGAFLSRLGYAPAN